MIIRLKFWKTQKTSIVIAISLSIILFLAASTLILNRTVIEPRNKNATTNGAKHYAFSKLKQGPGVGNRWHCLEDLWTRESGWYVRADNPGSTAYGIPQALPGSKMSSKGGDWRTNYRTQIRWGLDYIRTRYGDPCRAWFHSQRFGWY
jgi:hypothetical protein